MEIRPYTSKELASMTTEQLKNAFLDLAKKRNFSKRTVKVVTESGPEWRQVTKMEWFLMHPNDDEIITLREAFACLE